jgi:hypothetical protein
VIPPCCSHTSSVLGEGWQTTLLNIAKIAKFASVLHI